jgi:hypothetical protein
VLLLPVRSGNSSFRSIGRNAIERPCAAGVSSVRDRRLLQSGGLSDDELLLSVFKSRGWIRWWMLLLQLLFLLRPRLWLCRRLRLITPAGVIDRAEVDAVHGTASAATLYRLPDA